MSSTIPIRATTNGVNSTGASTSSVYGTTPGGTPRISYSRDQLLSLASSPLSRSPPAFLPAAISRSHQPTQQLQQQQQQQRKVEVGPNPTAAAESADSDTEDTATFKFEL